MNNRIWLLLAAAVALAGWAILTVWGLVAPYTESSRWVALVTGILAILGLILVLALGCSCTEHRRAAFEPSAAGITVGAALGLIIVIPLAVFAYVAEYVLNRAEYVRILGKLLIALGVIGGIVVFALILAGLIACAKGRRDADPSKDPVPPSPTRRQPDPWMYSQDWARTIGDPVTWDNPSVTIWDPATMSEESRFDVIANRDYRLMVEIQNGSNVAPVPVACLGATLTCYMKVFGIGGIIEEWLLPPNAPLAIPTIPATNPPLSAVVVEFDFRPATAGHRCLVFIIHHSDDANPANNKGQHNLEVIDVSQGQQFSYSVPVWNRLPEPPAFRFEQPGKPFRRAARWIGAVVMYPLSRPILLTRRFRNGSDAPKPRRLIPAVGTIQSVDFQLEQWAGRRKREPDEGWPAALDINQADLQLVAWDDSAALPSTLTLAGTVPATAQPGTTRLFNVTASADGRLIGGVSTLLKVI